MFDVKCPYCGRYNSARYENCAICNKKLPDDFEAETDYDLKKRLKRFSWLNRILLIVIVLIVLYIMHKSQTLALKVG